MPAANSPLLLILAIAIAMINISNTSMWGIPANGTCRSPGVRCTPPGHHNCTGVCNCQWYNDASTGPGYICMEPGSSPDVRRS
uniref:Putative tick defensin n=1 Tax=Rhipicephalus pulchellus TaxID=72859 RepID=L7M9C4_RHIPC